MADSERYFRQTLLFGETGQSLLKQSHVFIAGCGGLGSPIAMYLAAAGVGTITLADNDIVSLSNLNRQVLHWTEDIGREKAVSAQEKLQNLNPDIRISCIRESINSETIRTLAHCADIIIDAVDNTQTRQILNEYAITARKPFIHGAVHGFSGQMMVISPGKTACLRCLIHNPPQSGPIPVLGTTAGIIGLMQANEAIKIITNSNDVQIGIFVTWDGLSGNLRKFTVSRKESCPVCGDAGSLKQDVSD